VHHIMFDIDGTLVQSYQFDEDCFTDAVFEVLGHEIDSEWSNYKHVSDSGILSEHIKRQGIVTGHDEIHREVKKTFIKKIKAYLSENPASEVPGASLLINELKKLDSVSLSIATGGWQETAVLKLQSAGIDYSGIPVASSNDHFSRTAIMRASKEKAGVESKYKITYFGDADWDQKASKELGYNFILVGNRIETDKSIDDFTDINKVFSLIGI